MERKQLRSDDRAYDGFVDTMVLCLCVIALIFAVFVTTDHIVDDGQEFVELNTVRYESGSYNVVYIGEDGTIMSESFDSCKIGANDSLVITYWHSENAFTKYSRQQLHSLQLTNETLVELGVLQATGA